MPYPCFPVVQETMKYLEAGVREYWIIDEKTGRVFVYRNEDSVELSMLDAYGIPYILEYPNNGDFGIVIMGHAGGGVDIFVPETMLEDAQNIFNSEIIAEEQTEE